MKLSPIRVLVLALALAFCGGLFLIGADQAAAEEMVYSESVIMQTVPTTSFDGDVTGTDILYITSNGVPRRVFIADEGKAADKQPVAIYLNTSELLKGYSNGGSHDLW